jgi:S-DNA-T family DNA segregation ATPase FtsK/SpoIIIE
VSGEPPGDDLVRLAVIAEGPGGTCSDLIVEAGARCPSRDVVEAIAAAVGCDGGSSGAYSPRLGRMLGDDEPFVDWVLQGDRLVISGGARASDPELPAARELLVVGGALAGTRLPLRESDQVLGRDARCPLTLEDPALSRSHLRIRSSNGTVGVVDAGSRNGTAIEGHRVQPGEERRLAEGQLVRAGRTLFTVAAPRAEAAAPPDAGGGFVGFNRTMRVVRKFVPLERRIPAPPDDQQRYGRVGLLASLPFALLGVVLWTVTGSATMLLFIAITPMMALMSFVEERAGRKRGLARGRQKYRRALADLQGGARVGVGGRDRVSAR